MKPFEILNKELVLDSPWIPVEKQRVRLPNGKESDWYVVLGSEVVIVVPMLSDGRVVLQRAYKHGAGQVVTEFCAGMVDDGEEPIEAARRELLEESGYASDEMILLGSFYPNPTASRAKYHIFLAKNAHKIQDPELEPEEQIENFIVDSLADAEKYFLTEPSATGALAALHLAMRNES